MILSSFRFSSLLIQRLRNRLNFKHILSRANLNSHLQRAFLMGTGLIISLGYVFAIQDDSIRNLRSLMNKEISSLRNQYGQTTIYPQIKYELRGNTYEIIFEIDQRKCDLFTLISTFMNVYQTDKNFKVVDMKVFTNATNNLTTFYVDFQENDPKFKSKNSNIQPHNEEDLPSPE